jgi:hypothetical protein
MKDEKQSIDFSTAAELLAFGMAVFLVLIGLSTCRYVESVVAEKKQKQDKFAVEITRDSVKRIPIENNQNKDK